MNEPTNGNEKVLIAVVGATGAQGRGLVRAILEDPAGRFRVRALTRTVGSEAARELAQAGAEVVAADVDDVESLTRAFEGAHGAFCVTFFWDHFSAEKEMVHARNLATAAKAARVRHAIWSTLEDTRELMPVGDERMPTLLGSYKVPHFDAKGASDRVFEELGVPTTFLRTSFYWENFIAFGLGPKRGADGRLALTMPMGDKKLPGISAEDIGKAAFAIFARGASMIGKTVGVAGEHLTGAQMADVLARTLCESVRYDAVEADAYRALGFAGADELGNMFQFKRDFEATYCGARDVAKARELVPGLQSFAEWLARNGRRIPP